MFGAQSSSSSLFGTPSSTPAFGTPSSTPAFGTPSSTPAFGTPPTPAFTTGFGSSLFSTPASQQQQQQQQTPSSNTFGIQQQPSSNAFGIQNPSATPQQQQASLFQQFIPYSFNNAQLTTQMAPVAYSLADRDVQAIVDAYKEDLANPKDDFKHLLFSVTDPQYRAKPAGVSDIVWAEAMGKLEGMESSDRERLWPQLVQSFKDLSQRLKLQDEVIVSDAERLRMTQSNVKTVQRHFQADCLPWIQRLRQMEQGLQKRLLRVMRIVEGLEGKGFRLPLSKGEVELAERLAGYIRQIKGSAGELSRRVQSLMTASRIHSDGFGGRGSMYLPEAAQIQEESLADMHQVLQQQTLAIARLGNVLKRDIRDMEIIMAEGTE